jgi:hypothetical protein
VAAFRDDAVAHRPPEPEEQRLEGVRRPADTPLVLRVRPGFVRQEEAGAGDGRVRPGVEQAPHVAGLGHASGTEQRDLVAHGGTDRGDRVPPGLLPLHDQPVHAGTQRRLRRSRRPHGVEHEQPAGTQAPDDLRIGATVQDDEVRALGQARLDMSALRERSEEVRGHRPARRTAPGVADRGAEGGRTHDPDGAQSAGGGHGPGEGAGGDTPTHPGLDDGMLEAQSVTQVHGASVQRKRGMIRAPRGVILAARRPRITPRRG